MNLPDWKVVAVDDFEDRAVIAPEADAEVGRVVDRESLSVMPEHPVRLTYGKGRWRRPEPGETDTEAWLDGIRAVLGETSEPVLLREDFNASESRGPDGKWTRSAVETLGSTPYYKTDDSKFPRATYEEALALHDSPAWKPRFAEYEDDARRMAANHGVAIKMTRNVGVFEGAFEPSYAIEATGAKAAIAAFNKELGDTWGQDAVVGFERRHGGLDYDVEFQLPASGDKNAFYRDLVGVLGEKDAGASYNGDRVGVFVSG